MGQDQAQCIHKKGIYQFDRYIKGGREEKARLVKLKIFDIYINVLGITWQSEKRTKVKVIAIVQNNKTQLLEQNDKKY